MSSNLIVSHKCTIIQTKALFVSSPPQLSPKRYTVFTLLSILFSIRQFNVVHTSIDTLPPHLHDDRKLLLAELQGYAHKRHLP